MLIRHLTTTFIAIAVCCFANAAIAGDTDAPAGYVEPVQVELSEADLEEIKTLMIQHAAVLVSSPGIKHVDAQQVGEAVTASVLFYPHEQSGGIAHAINAQCHKETADVSWVCPSGSLRSYLQVPGQDFEVRVFGSVDYDMALALIKVTGDVIRSHPNLGVETPDTVVVIVPTQDTMTVGWGDSEGFLRVHVEAMPVAGGRARTPEGWRVTSVNDQPWQPTGS
ncbi:MAG: hypothetical protein ACR2QU_01640 [Gammaproteobacteria bacterium]